MLMDRTYFMRRVGTENERPKDRKFAYRLWYWDYKRRWNEAVARKDYDAMERMHREYGGWQAL